MQDATAQRTTRLHVVSTTDKEQDRKINGRPWHCAYA